MALHDFRCPACRLTLADVYIPITVRASEKRPLCPECDQRMEWIPAVGSMDTQGPGFTPFTIERRQRDGSHVTQTIDSLHTLRRVERETEVEHRNGEGQALRFRMWNNLASNGDVNTFGKDPSQLAQEEVAGHRARLSADKGDRVRQAHGEARF